MRLKMMLCWADRSVSAAASCVGGKWEMHEHEMADARRDRRPRAAWSSSRAPGGPFVIMRDRVLDMPPIGDRRARRSKDGGSEIERTADAVQHVGDMRWAVGPAEARAARP